MRVHGKAAQLFLNGTKILTAVQWDFDAQAEYVDNTVFGATGKTYLRGLFAVNGSFSGLMDVGNTDLWTAMTAGLVTVALWADATHLIATGQGWIDAGGTAAANDAVRMKGTIKGSGSWTFS
jgi:hypothetical protein